MGSVSLINMTPFNLFKDAHFRFKSKIILLLYES